MAMIDTERRPICGMWCLAIALVPCVFSVKCAYGRSYYVSPFAAYACQSGGAARVETEAVAAADASTKAGAIRSLTQCGRRDVLPIVDRIAASASVGDAHAVWYAACIAHAQLERP